MKGKILKSKKMQSAYDRFLRTLCNKTRLAIIHSLLITPKNVSLLTLELGIHQTSVSHALKRLLVCGFVEVEKNGKERLYSLNNSTIKPLMKLMEQHTQKYCKNCLN
jgi:DNA-binding transcriptional ArsR family regulator